MKESAAIHRDEIAHLAYLNWQWDGCPSGRDQDYWYEAEHQMKATKHLLVEEDKLHINGNNAATKSRKPGRLKSTSNADGA